MFDTLLFFSGSRYLTLDYLLCDVFGCHLAMYRIPFHNCMTCFIVMLVLLKCVITMLCFCIQDFPVSFYMCEW